VLPKLHVETFDYPLSLFSRRFVILADEINGFNEMAIPAKKVRSVVRHVTDPRPSAPARRNGAARALSFPPNTSGGRTLREFANLVVSFDTIID
jgi:hypothetical protein